ncbi:esterase-like activity of phytase family protein [Hyphobacterium sp.]|uniref:esterase-like activity of phytase family protein n=1 Tax=Hyphobacterium sp. TaxID=2004662 RepID=UPI003BA94E3F
MRVLIGLMALGLAACSGDPGPGPIRIETESVPLYPDQPERLDVGQLEYRGGIVLSSPDGRFGGLSALEVEGSRMLAISDSAYWFTASLEFDDAGWLTGVSNTFYAPMLGEDGQHLTGTAADSEGLAPLGNGAYAVSFEREHRISRYDISPDWSGVAIATPDPLEAVPNADRLRNNGGMEALAPAENGYWVAVEFPILDGRPHSLWRISDGQEPLVADYPTEAGFGLTGLAREGDTLFILERFYSRDVGNRIAIFMAGASQFDQDNVSPVALPIGALEPGMTVDNFEGIAIGRVNGEMRLFILSDDNFSNTQRTLLLSFAFAE